MRARRAGATLSAAFDEWFATITSIVPGERYPTATVAVEVLAEALDVPIDVDPARRSRHDLSAALNEMPPASGRRSVPDLAPPSGRLAGSELTMGAAASGPTTSGSTSPIPLRPPLPFWKRPTAMPLTLAVLAVLITIIVVWTKKPAADPDGLQGTGSQLAAFSGSTASSTTPAPAASSSSDPQAASATAPLQITTSASAAAASTAPLVRRPPVPASSVKRPKYTRD